MLKTTKKEIFLTFLIGQLLPMWRLGELSPVFVCFSYLASREGGN